MFKIMMAGLIKTSIVAILLIRECHSFVVPLSQGVTAFRVQKSFDSSALMATKRRKRKETGSTNSAEFDPDGDELPDFYIPGEEDVDDAEIARTSARMAAMGEVEITDAMMGTQQQLGTINDLLSDRSLEAKFQFEEPNEPLPDLVELAKSKSYGRGESNSPEGSKRAEQAARKAAAMAAEDIQEQEEGILSILKAKLSKDKDGEALTPIKVRSSNFLKLTTMPSLASLTLSLFSDSIV
jgi:hypothetical protein